MFRQLPLMQFVCAVYTLCCVRAARTQCVHGMAATLGSGVDLRLSWQIDNSCWLDPSSLTPWLFWPVC